jgi:hypothetical protein
VNDALELVDGFPADQDPVGAAPKWRLCSVVAQVDRIPPLAPLRTRTMELGVPRSRTKAFEQESRRTVAIVGDV